MKIGSHYNTQWKKAGSPTVCNTFVICIYIWTSLELHTHVRKWGFWVFLPLFPKIPFSTREHALGFPPPALPCSSNQGGGEALQTECPTGTLDPLPLGVCDPAPALVLQDFLSLCLPSLSWFTQGRASGCTGLIKLCLPETESQPAAQQSLELSHIHSGPWRFQVLWLPGLLCGFPLPWSLTFPEAWRFLWFSEWCQHPSPRSGVLFITVRIVAAATNRRPLSDIV